MTIIIYSVYIRRGRSPSDSIGRLLLVGEHSGLIHTRDPNVPHHSDIAQATCTKSTDILAYHSTAHTIYRGWMQRERTGESWCVRDQNARVFGQVSLLRNRHHISRIFSSRAELFILPLQYSWS
jgi:hypothetical protein